MWNDEPTKNFRPIRGRLAGEPAFRKTAKLKRLPTKFLIGMAIDGVLRLGLNFVWEHF